MTSNSKVDGVVIIRHCDILTATNNPSISVLTVEESLHHVGSYKVKAHTE